jgi:UDP-glucose 4-epimerase
MASCLVIGGGLLGGAAAHALADRDHDVLVFSRSFGEGLEETSEQAGRRIQRVAGSISPTGPLGELIDETDVILYFAGGSTPAGAVEDPGQSVQLSVVPATTVLELICEASPTRIVLASSGGTVYGEPRGHPTAEDHPAHPIGLHGHNALTIERYAAFFARHHSLEPVILRIATAYGPGQRTKRGQGVIAAWIEAALAGEALQVYGDQQTRRDFVYVSDIAEAAALAAFEAAPGTYNVGSGTSHTLAEVTEMLAEIAGHELELNRRPGRGVDVHHTELDCSRLAAATGWRPSTSLRSGLQATWEWWSARELTTRAAG